MFNNSSHNGLDVFRLTAADRAWKIAAVQDQDALLRASGDVDGPFPFGLLLWESAIVLADALAEIAGTQAIAARAVGTGEFASNLGTVLELGCGVGLSGLAASSCGAAKVVMTDHDGRALAVARRNAAINGIGNVELELRDWTRWCDAATYNTIIGADVLYEKDHHGSILSILTRNLEPGGRAVLTDPCRHDLPLFLDAASAAGLSVKTSARSTPDLSHPGRMVHVTLIELAKS